MQESETFILEIPSTWNKEVEKVDASMETMPMLQREVGCDPMKPFHATTQTETTMDERLSARGVIISKETIDMILEGIEDASKMNKYFEKLEAFRKTEKLQLVLIKKIQLESNEKLPIVGIKCGRNGRIALLLGHSQHESWCFHSGKVIIFHKNRSTNIPLASCPTQLVFAPQQQVIVATASGEILVTFEGEILWQSDSIHSQAITCLQWVSPNLLFSAGLDGRLVISSLKATSLEAIKSSSITVSDLPRSMRRSNTSSRRTGVVGIAGSKRDYFLAGETGAIWSLNADSLIVQPIGNDSDGIEQLYTSPNGFIAVTPEKGFKTIANDAITSEYFLAGHKTTCNICFRESSLLLFIDTGATNSGPLLGYDLVEESLVLRENSQKYFAIDFNDENGEVVALNSKYEIDIFQFID